MKVEVRDGTRETQVLTGMIVDTAVVTRVAAHWSKQMFASPWANLIGDWCVKYHKRYGRAPGKDIRLSFEGWIEEHPGDESTALLVGNFLGSLSDRYESVGEDINPDSLLDLAGKYFQPFQ